MKRDYRDKSEMYHDILKVCDNLDENSPPIMINISREANVAHPAAVKYVTELGEFGLIDSYKIYSTNYGWFNRKYRIGFKTTPKGKEFLKSYENLKSFLTKVRDLDYRQAPEDNKDKNC